MRFARIEARIHTTYIRLFNVILLLYMRHNSLDVCYTPQMSIKKIIISFLRPFREILLY